ncbi:hypothetical protein OO25_18295 [Phaeobacter sp. S60]|nr:hypothetical protein OO25_18295 [Phaeobacter sp. S60]
MKCQEGLCEALHGGGMSNHFRFDLINEVGSIPYSTQQKTEVLMLCLFKSRFHYRLMCLQEPTPLTIRDITPDRCDSCINIWLDCHNLTNQFFAAEQKIGTFGMFVRIRNQDDALTLVLDKAVDQPPKLFHGQAASLNIIENDCLRQFLKSYFCEVYLRRVRSEAIRSKRQKALTCTNPVRQFTVDPRIKRTNQGPVKFIRAVDIVK